MSSHFLLCKLLRFVLFFAFSVLFCAGLRFCECVCRCVLVTMCSLYRLWPVLGLLNGLTNWMPVVKSQEALRREDVGSLVSELLKCPENQQLCKKV